MDQLDAERPADPSAVAHLQFTPQCVTPICSTIQKLNVNEFSGFNPIHGAFILRHFSNLQQSLDVRGRAVCLLHQQLQPNVTSEPTTFQRSSEELGLIEWTVNAPFRGQLNLIELCRIDYKNRKEMEAITALCPLLKEAEFNCSGNETTSTDDLLSPIQLRSLLSTPNSCWTKVKSISFWGVPTYRRVVLDCLRDQLRNLKLEYCRDVDPLLELSPLKPLETLTINKCNLTPIVNAAAFAERVPRAVLADCANQFLPALKELTSSDTCLGYWSRLFECRRPNLIKLNLFCSHLGLPSVSRFDWSDAPNLWPNLEILGLPNNESEPSPNELKSIAPYLNEFQHLRKLIVTFIYSSGIGYLSPSECSDVLAQLGHPLPVGLRVGTCDYTMDSSISHFCHYHQS